MKNLIERYKADKSKVVAEKSAAMKFCDASGGYVSVTPTNLNKMCENGKCILTKGGSDSNGFVTLKGVSETENEVAEKVIVGNTYNWLDSHGDVHVKGCFAKSIKEDPTPAHLHDHEFKILSQIGDVQKTFEQRIAWRTLGVDKDGLTQALMIKSDVKKEYNPAFYEMYKDGKIQQHSVGMRYVDIELAVNSEEKWAKVEKATWDEYVDKVANISKDTTHFWVVKEAKLIEVSAVLRGSNTLTPTIKEIDIAEPTKKDKTRSDNDLEKLIRTNLKFL